MHMASWGMEIKEMSLTDHIKLEIKQKEWGY